MIASLKGVAQHVGPDHAVIEVGGVGYLVQSSSRTLGSLEPGAAIFLLVETQVREDAITLFGFAHAGERDWFRLLTSVQGVGGKVALAILGALSADELSRAITLDDKAMIARAQGVHPDGGDDRGNGSEHMQKGGVLFSLLEPGIVIFDGVHVVVFTVKRRVIHWQYLAS